MQTRPIIELIRLALAEDVVENDITSLSVFGKKGHASQGILLAKQDLACSGIEVARQVFKEVSSAIRFTPEVKDGASVKRGGILGSVKGPVTDLLRAERVVLNFLQRLSGVATLTRRFVAASKPYKARILDTRKTTPGFRALEKQAVVHGGGYNHRMNLSDQYLIKDNHIAACGSIGATIRAAQAHRKNLKGKKPLIQAEAKNLAEVREALEAGVDILLLDNMTLVQIKQSVAAAKGKTLLEVSGGVNLKTVRKIAQTGVDRISIGALTHSAPSVDISFEIE